ncbi:MAG: hypothetical protein QOE76_2125, partial [Frankiales bacterium]|nr:hypothetical protein [Frankiales bacterium]
DLTLKFVLLEPDSAAKRLVYG